MNGPLFTDRDADVDGAGGNADARPGPFVLSAFNRSLFPKGRKAWLALTPPLPKSTGDFWIELAHEINILAVPAVVRPRATAATICADLDDFVRYRSQLVEHGGFVCLPERPYVGGLPGDALVEELADRDPTLSRLFDQGRIITWTEDDLRVGNHSEPANPFGLAGMLALLARFGAEQIYVASPDCLVEEQSMPLFMRRFLGAERVIETLRLSVEPLVP